MITLLIIFFICFLMISSIRWFWIFRSHDMPSIEFGNFLLLIMTYTTIFVGFGLIYFVLEMAGYQVISEMGTSVTGEVLELLEACLYFSAATLFSVGYGDIVPIEIGRWLSIFEALLGYVMPAAFVVRTFIDYEKGANENK